MQRRSRLRWWVHAIWGACYSLFILAMMGSFGAQGWRDLVAALPLFTPLLLVIVQVAYPTILGWALISLPGIAYVTAPLIVLVVSAILEPTSFGLAEIAPGLAFLGFLALLVGGLAATGWPSPLESAAP